MQIQPYLYFDGRCEEAIGFYRAALVLRPQGGGIYVKLGAALTGLGKYVEAEEAAREAGKLEACATFSSWPAPPQAGQSSVRWLERRSASARRIRRPIRRASST